MLYRPGQPGTSPLHTDQVITNTAPLPFPLEAKLDKTNELITVVQTCNWANNSPAGIGIDSQGKLFLATFDELTVIDQRGVPNPAVQAIRSGRAA